MPEAVAFFFILFGVFQLDGPARRLLRNGREIHLRPKAFELLARKIQERGIKPYTSKVADYKVHKNVKIRDGAG